jgi:hypothetical protein
MVALEGLASAPPSLGPPSRADLVHPAQLEECYWAVLAEAAAVVDLMSRPLAYLPHWARLAVPAAAAMNWHSSRFRHRLADWGLAFLEKPFLKLWRCSCAEEVCVVDDEGFGDKNSQVGFVCLFGHVFASPLRSDDFIIFTLQHNCYLDTRESCIARNSYPEDRGLQVATNFNCSSQARCKSLPKCLKMQMLGLCETRRKVQ